MAVASLRLVLGDQLSAELPVVAGADASRDLIAMIEAPGEATHVWSHKARIALFLSAMRHFAASLRERGLPLAYVALDDHDAPSLAARLATLVAEHAPGEVVVCEPGEWRVLRELQDTCARLRVPLRVLPDTRFLCDTGTFARWAHGRGSLRMEHFYREMRRRHRVLLDDAGEPEGGRWNFDADNRAAYPAAGPGAIPPPARFDPDAITRDVISLVEARFPSHPGSLDAFGWPVTRGQALEALERFVDDRLIGFGRYQDAMWTDTPFGWHALLSSSLNLGLLSPRETIDAVERAWRERRPGVDLASVEGFVRQVLGWREFVRGVYWHFMPGLVDENRFGHDRPLPAWFWSGDTRMACLRDAIGQTLRHGHAHHIQRLMLTGNFSLLAGLSPAEVQAWYLAVYVDAVEWVEAPNVVGMALFADGGRFTSKPYVASGAYVERMSDHCDRCAYRPRQRTGEAACPMTTLYWAFLDRHEAMLAANPRTALMVRNLARIDEAERAAIRARADEMLAGLDAL